MKRLDENKLNIKLNDLNIPSQAKKKFAHFQIENISDFLCYDCPENTRFTSYGIIPLKIGKNSRKRIYQELAKLDIPRAFMINENDEAINLTTNIFALPLSIMTINKLYRCGFKTIGDCLEQSIFTKKCLGEDYDELVALTSKKGWEIKQVAVSDDLRLVDLELPRKLNVLENEKIKKDHMAWHSEVWRWAQEVKYRGLVTIGEVKKLGYSNFVQKHGHILDNFLQQYEIVLPDCEKNTQLQELQEMRLLVEMLLDVYDGDLAPEEEQDIVGFAKRIVRKND